jgi:hypothetical protein
MSISSSIRVKLQKSFCSGMTSIFANAARWLPRADQRFGLLALFLRRSAKIFLAFLDFVYCTKPRYAQPIYQ